jgi:colicin import membrane protein
LSVKNGEAQPDYFKTAFFISAAGHAILLSFFIVRILFFSKPLIDLSQAISVNVEDFAPTRALPQKKTEVPAEPAPEVKEETPPEKDITPPKETAPPKEETKAKPEPLPKKAKTVETKKDEINLKKAKNRQKEAFEKIKKLSALEKIKQEVASESKAAKAAKPRVISAGSALTGLDKIEANEYLKSLDGSIKQYWQLPQWLINKNLRAQVLVKFSTAGQLISTKILTSSGNTSYDNYCLQAINKAAPFPKVPAKFSEKFSIDGLIVGFPE